MQIPVYKLIKNIACTSNHVNALLTFPCLTTDSIAISSLILIACLPNSVSALFLAISRMISLFDIGIAMISSLRHLVHMPASGSLRKPVTPSMIDSTGPPLFADSTMSPAAIASTGPIPKCSFDGVYSKVRVDGAVSRAVLWAVLKLSRKRMSDRSSVIFFAMGGAWNGGTTL